MSRILVVDDEKDVCDLLSSALRIAGYDTDVASNGEEALRLWRSRDIDLCIVDINMPVMDGFVFLETIRDQDVYKRQLKGLTKQLTEARQEALDRLTEAAQAMGATAVLAVRYDSNELAGTFQEILAYGTAVIAEPIS